MTYKIIDESRSPMLSRFVCNPVWVMLITLLSPVIGLSLFAVNSLAIGSPAKYKEWACVIAGLLFFWLCKTIIYPVNPYFDIALSVIRLSIAYRIFLYQAGPYQVFQYFKSKES